MRGTHLPLVVTEKVGRMCCEGVVGIIMVHWICVSGLETENAVEVLGRPAKISRVEAPGLAGGCAGKWWVLLHYPVCELLGGENEQCKQSLCVPPFSVGLPPPSLGSREGLLMNPEDSPAL